MHDIEHPWVKRLIQSVPGMEARLDPFDQGLPYVAFGLFATYVRHLCQQEPINMAIVGPALALMTEMAESEEDAVQGLLAVGTLEGLVGSVVILNKLRPRMPPRLRHLFDYTALAWYGDPPLNWSQVDLNIAPDSDSLEQALARIRQANPPG